MQNNQELREEAFYILGVLEYQFDNIDNAIQLIKDNDFELALRLINTIKTYNRENTAKVKIILNEEYPRVKADTDQDHKFLQELAEEWEIKISY